METKNLIRKGKKLLINENTEIFSVFSKIYPMTSENIKETYKNFDLTNKTILTVSSSGDHILEAILKGADKIDSFDINFLTEYYFYLKKALIETYDLNNFKEILLNNIIQLGIIKENWYTEIRKNINGEYQKFWDEIIDYSLTNKLSINKMFLETPNNLNLISYLEEESYQKLQNSLKNININFIHSNLLHLNKHLEDKYDYMFLSNISDYLGVNEVRDYAENKLIDNLNENGEIAFAYMYDATLIKAKRFNPDKIYPITSTCEYKDTKDYVLTLKK